MRLRVVSERTEIPNLNPIEKMVHLAFRASNVDFLNLMQRCPRLRTVQVLHSYQKTMSNAIKVFLDMQGIELLEEMSGATERTSMNTTRSRKLPLRKFVLWRPAVRLLTMWQTRFQKKAKIGQDLIKYIAKTKITA
jgi:hypothetical protein